METTISSGVDPDEPALGSGVLVRISSESTYFKLGDLWLSVSTIEDEASITLTEVNQDGSREVLYDRELEPRSDEEQETFDRIEHQLHQIESRSHRELEKVKERERERGV